MREHVIPTGVLSMPLRRYLLRAFPAMPPWLVRETLKKRDVRVNGVKSGPDAAVHAGDVLAIYVDERYLTGLPDVIYEDSDLLVIEKPAGVSVDVDGQGIGADTMISRLRAVCPGARLCHRLDTWTGGVLIAAKNDAAEEHMRAIFRSHELTKLYQCVVTGDPPQNEIRLTGWLQKDSAASRVRVLDHPSPGAQPIETRCRTLTSRNGLARLEVELITGRTHQIRAHLSHVGLPLLGDDKYGNREANRRWKVTQPLLWCVRISFEGHVFESPPKFGGVDI